jgi:hypothetical protein
MPNLMFRFTYEVLYGVVQGDVEGDPGPDLAYDAMLLHNLTTKSGTVSNPEETMSRAVEGRSIGEFRLGRGRNGKHSATFETVV